MPNILLFDLDGTLIDSAPGILDTFATALALAGIAPVVPLDQSLIGPPLRVTLGRIASTQDQNLIDRLVAHFRESYDTTGYRKTKAYSGVDDALRSLAANSCWMFIVTNKRIHPTRLILEMLEWTGLFSGIYALDAVSPAVSSKGALISQLMKERTILAQDACFVGDTLEDAQAAQENGLRFIGVRWGYGQFTSDVLRDRKVLDDPTEITRLRLL